MDSDRKKGFHVCHMGGECSCILKDVRVQFDRKAKYNYIVII